MPIKLNGETGGSVSFDAPDNTSPGGTDVTLTLPTSAGSAGQYLRNSSTAGTLEFGNLSISGSDLPADSILNIEQATKTDGFTTTSTSFVDVTDLSVSITPSSASSKVLLICMLSNGGSSTGTMHGKIVANGSDLFVGDAGGASQNRVNFSRNTYNIESNIYNDTFVYLHSPSSTSEQTYKVQVLSAGGHTVAINRTQYDYNNAYHGRTASSMIAMEIKG